MDYRALAELIWMSLLGLSILALVAGLSVRVFLAPVLRQILEKLNEGRSEDQARLAARLELMESRLEGMESEVHRLGAADDFYRKLGVGAEAAGEELEGGAANDPVDNPADDPADTPGEGPGDDRAGDRAGPS